MNGSRIRARRGVLVATGSKPLSPPIPGLEDVDCWTNHEAIETEQLPFSLAVLGAGPVGCELGQVFARFGSAVTIIDVADRLRSREEPEASPVVAASLAADGIELRLGARAASVTADDDSIVVELDDGSTVTAARLLVASGRRADADRLGVAAAGGSTERGFLKVDRYLRAADGLWAIGDVTGAAMLTHVAEYQSMITAEDILGGAPAPADYSVLPRATFTDPEVGGVGMTEEAARAAGHKVTVTAKDLRATFRGWTYGGRQHRCGQARRRPGEGPAAGRYRHGTERHRSPWLPRSGRSGTDAAAQARPHHVRVPTFYGGIGEAIGGFVRGLVRVLDPATAPMFDDPRPAR